MATALAALLSRDALESFLGSCLFEGGVWESPRTSDGVESFQIEHVGDGVRVRGRIWRIEQTVHTFRLDLRRDGTWSLDFDSRVELAGDATIRDDGVAIVLGSIRRV